MLRKIAGKPVILSVQGHNWNRCNVLTHHLDIVEEQTLAFDSLGNNTDDTKWIIEEHRNTRTYYIRAYGKFGRGYCITAMNPDFTWQVVTLAPLDELREEQRWKIHRCNRGHYRFNNLRHMNKYLSKVPSVHFDTEQNIAVISPPYEIIRIGYVLLDWHLTLTDNNDIRENG